MSYLEFAKFDQRPAQPERVIMIIDQSGSMEEEDYPPSRLHGAIEAAKALIDVKARSYPQDEVGVVSFSSDADIVHPPVPVAQRIGSLHNAMERLKPQSSTNIHAALYKAQQALFRSEAGMTPDGSKMAWGKRISQWLFDENQYIGPSPSSHERLLRTILLTDGAHNDGPTPLSLAQQMKAAGVVIDCVGIGGCPRDVEEATLKAIASRNSDGSIRYCFIRDKAKLIRKFEQLANRIRPV